MEQRLHELIQIFLERILDPDTNHLNHFFDERWRVRSDTYTFGRDIEASWLLCEAAEVLDDPALFQRVRKVALEMAETVLSERVLADGGLAYEGEAGILTDTGRECWPQAEAVVGVLERLSSWRRRKIFRRGAADLGLC